MSKSLFRLINEKEFDKYRVKDKKYMIAASPITISKFGPSGSLINMNDTLENTIAVIARIINEIFLDLKYMFVIIL